MSLVLANDDIIMVRNVYTTATTTGANILHYRVAAFVGSAPPMSEILPIIGQEMYELFEASWAVAAAADTTFARTDCANTFPAPRSLTVSYAPNVPTVGLIAGQALPMQDSPTIIKQTESGQRWGRGRVFVIGTPEAEASLGKVTPAQLTRLNNISEDYDETVGIIGVGYSFLLEPVLLSGKDTAPTRVTRIVDGRISDDVIKSQRRRRPGNGT